jgi:hypothetical protein
MSELSVAVMSDRIYTVDEFYTEKPKGELLLRDSDGKLFSVFQCHGCQTCWKYVDAGTNNADDDRIEQMFPHLYRCDEVTEV